MNGNGYLSEEERIFRFLRRVNRQKDVEIVLTSLPGTMLGQCKVRIELDLPKIALCSEDRVDLLVHEIGHGLDFEAHEWTIRRRTKRRLKKLSRRGRRRLNRFLERLGAPKN